MACSCCLLHRRTPQTWGVGTARRGMAPLGRFIACWGNGQHGRLGHMTRDASELFPRLVAALAGQQAARVACGGAHTAAVMGKQGALSAHVLLRQCWSSNTWLHVYMLTWLLGLCGAEISCAAGPALVHVRARCPHKAERSPALPHPLLLPGDCLRGREPVELGPQQTRPAGPQQRFQALRGEARSAFACAAAAPPPGAIVGLGATQRHSVPGAPL